MATETIHSHVLVRHVIETLPVSIPERKQVLYALMATLTPDGYLAKVQELLGYLEEHELAQGKLKLVLDQAINQKS